MTYRKDLRAQHRRRTKRDRPANPRWGWHGYEVERRDHDGWVDIKVGPQQASTLGRDHTERVRIYTPGRVYDYRTVSAADRARLEAEIGAPFVPRPKR